MNRNKSSGLSRRFSADLDACLEGQTVSAESQEYRDLLTLGKVLASAGLGTADHKEAVKARFMTQAGAPALSKRKPFGRRLAGGLSVAAAMVVLLGVLAVKPSFAESVLNRVIAAVTLGHITAFQVEPPPEDLAYPVPEALRGKVFSRDGVPVNEVNGHTGPLYTADGQEIYSFADGKIITKAQEKARRKKNVRILTDPDTLSDHVNFKVKLPAYLPEGYTFSHAEQYVDEQGKTSPKYLELYFGNSYEGREIMMQQRYADEETATIQSTTGKIEQVKVNGADGFTVDARTIDWEEGGVLYFISTKHMGEAIGKEGLIRIAESLK